MNIEEEIEDTIVQSNLPMIVNTKIKEQLEYMKKVAEEAIWR